MKQKISIISLILLLSTYSFGQMPIAPEEFQKLNQTIYAIKRLYVDDVEDTKIVDNAIKGMLESLDPHSVYIPAEDVDKANEPIKGSFDGIGIQFQMQKDTLVVVNPLRNCPAEKVGVLMGDKIIEVDGKNIAGVKISNSEIMKLLRGERGSKVNVKIKRNGVKKPIDFVIIRDKIPLYSIEVAYEIAPKIGYINISSFSLTTVEEFEKALNKLRKQNIESLIIDLQMNGGGVMSAAIDIIDKFIPKNKEILFTKGANNPRTSFFSRDNVTFEGNLVVLIDEYSASASEIVAGSLQDWDRAIIVGRRSFGKGLVQRPLNLIDGSEIRLTVARYYTPSGRNIQKPYEEGKNQYQKELLNRYQHGEFQHKDSINFPDSLKFKTLIKGRTVYGGGGIMPDVFVPLDTTTITEFHRDIIAKGIFNQEIIKFTEKNKSDILKKFKDFKEFEKNYIVPTSIFDQMLDLAQKEKIEIVKEQVNKSKPLILLQIKASIARNLYEQGDFYKIMNTNNEIVQKGIKVLQDFDNYMNK